MIDHYVDAHDYLPPQVFLDVLAVAPLPGTDEYLVAVSPFRQRALRAFENLPEPLIAQAPSVLRGKGHAAWDRTHDWVLVRRHQNLAEVRFFFAGPSPSPSELIALRKVLPELADKSLVEVRKNVGQGGGFSLGILSGIEARRVEQAALRHGLRVEREDHSRVAYLPMDRTANTAWLIEDDAEAERVAIEMMEAGIPVQHQEED
jgi:hypothetical protein